MKHLSIQAKEAILEKALSRDLHPLIEIAKSHNIGYSTLQRWISQYKANPQGSTQKQA